MLAMFGKMHGAYLETDYSRFDQSINEMLLMIEHHVYLQMYDTPEFRELLSVQLGTTSCHVNGAYNARRGGRCSGDANTSIGNCIINLFIAYIAHLKIGAKLVGFVEGDDGIFVDQPGLAAAFKETAAEFGLRLDCVSTDNPKFCGRYYDENWNSLADLQRAIRKFSISFNTTHDPLVLLRAKAMSVLSTDPTNIIFEFCNVIIQRTDKVKDRKRPAVRWHPAIYTQPESVTYEAYYKQGYTHSYLQYLSEYWVRMFTDCIHTCVALPTPLPVKGPCPAWGPLIGKINTISDNKSPKMAKSVTKILDFNKAMRDQAWLGGKTTATDITNVSQRVSGVRSGQLHYLLSQRPYDTNSDLADYYNHLIGQPDRITREYNHAQFVSRMLTRRDQRRRAEADKTAVEQPKTVQHAGAINNSEIMVKARKRQSVLSARRKRGRIPRRGNPSARLVRTLSVAPLTSANRVTPRRATRVAASGSKLHPRSVDFLKAALAPVDFKCLDVQGVPDEYVGPSVVKQSVYIGTITIPPSGSTYLGGLPTPGIAYWSADTPGSDWTPTYMGDYTSTFPVVNGIITSNFLSYRVIGIAMELKPISAMVSNAGVLLTAKIPLKVSVDQHPDVTGGETPKKALMITGSDIMRIDMTGCDKAAIVNGPVFVSHPNDGCYTMGFNCGDWSFNPVYSDVDAIPPSGVYILGYTGNLPVTTMSLELASVTATSGRLVAPTGKNIPGFASNHESIVMHITNANTTSALVMSLEVRHIIEYQVNPSSLFYPLAQPSAPHDRMALDLYAYALTRVPVAVTYPNNAGFWETCLRIWKGLLAVVGAGSVAAGPFAPMIMGATAGLGALTAGIEALTL